MEFTKLIATLLFMISILFVGAMNTQAAKLCPVNKSFHVSEYCDETPGNPDCCTCPEGTKWSNVSAAYRQCIPTSKKLCPVNKSFHVSEYCGENPGNPNCCICPEGTKWSNVSAAYRQCKS